MNYSTMHDPSVFAEMTAEAMKASDFVTKLGASFKADGTCMQKVNSGYPVLTWQQLGEGQSEHTFKVTATVDATCTEAGSKTYTCTACGETKAEEIPALGHNVGEGGICSRCGEKIAYLSALRLTAYNASGDYVFTPEFDGKTAEYQVAIPDADGFSAFLWATLSENAPEGSTIKAEWTNLYNGKTQSTAITSGKTSGQSLANFSRDAKPNTVTLTVGVDGNTQTYTLTSFRTPHPVCPERDRRAHERDVLAPHGGIHHRHDGRFHHAQRHAISGRLHRDLQRRGVRRMDPAGRRERHDLVVVSNADGLSTSYTVKATKHAICKVRDAPSGALRNAQTSFIHASPDITLTIPSTAQNVISVGAYDSQTNRTAAFSGRGYTWAFDSIKPDIIAPGVDIISCSNTGGYTSKTGTSMAAPFVTGAAALLMEWGIVRGNDLYMYGDKLKASLIKGAGENVFTAASRAVSENTSKNTKYPNPVTGWGTLCLLDSIP